MLTHRTVLASLAGLTLAALACSASPALEPEPAAPQPLAPSASAAPEAAASAPASASVSASAAPLAASSAPVPPVSPLVEVARSAKQWTGVAVSQENRVFVSYPRWSDDVPVSVAEIKDGKPLPFPDAAWNSHDPKDKKADLGRRFVAVQSVVTTPDNTLWVLDTGNPKIGTVLRGAAKLVAIDLAKNAVREVISFDEKAASGGSYLNDVRIDLERKVAYLTDSGRGGLVVLDLATKKARRVLEKHPSTHSEEIDVTIEGKPWRRDGKAPRVQADGLALSPDGAWLVYQALTGRTLYRVPTEALRDPRLTEQALGARVVEVGKPGPADGLAFSKRGIFHTSLEQNAIRRLDQDGVATLIVQDDRLAWPDSLAFGPDGSLWITTSLIHRGAEPRDAYGLWKISADRLR